MSRKSGDHSELARLMDSLVCLQLLPAQYRTGPFDRRNRHGGP
jgi:hypothetical protein